MTNKTNTNEQVFSFFFFFFFFTIFFLPIVPYAIDINMNYNFNKVGRIFQNIICKFSILRITFTILWANTGDNKLMIFFFSYFFQKTEFEISCKLSPNLHEMSNPDFKEI